MEAFSKEELKNEEWRDIPLAELKGRYQVSDLGRVRSLDYYSHINHWFRLNKGRIRKTVTGKDGYVRIVIIYEGKSISYLIHRLVALAFVENPNPEEYDVVNHRDETRNNNRSKNLEWCTQKYNTNYGSAIGRSYEKRKKTGAFDRFRNSGTKPVRATLPDGNVLDFKSMGSAAKHFGINHACLSYHLNENSRFNNEYLNNVKFEFI